MLEKTKEFLKSQAEKTPKAVERDFANIHKEKAEFVRNTLVEYAKYLDASRGLKHPDKSFEDRLEIIEDLNKNAELDDSYRPDNLDDNARDFIFNDQRHFQNLKLFLSSKYQPPHDDYEQLLYHLLTLSLYYEYLIYFTPGLPVTAQLRIDFVMAKVVIDAKLHTISIIQNVIPDVKRTSKSTVGTHDYSYNKKQRPIFEAVDELKAEGYKFTGTDYAVVMKIRDKIQELIDKKVERGEEKEGTKAPWPNTIIKHLGGNGLPKVCKT